MSQDKERIIFNAFKEMYNVPKGNEIHCDKPDYRIETENKIIGIEITEAVISEKELRQFKFQVSLTDEVLKLLEDKLPFTFSISIEPKKDADLPVKKKRIIIEEILKLCCRECKTLQNLDIYRVNNFDEPINQYSLEVQEDLLKRGYRNLPEGINEISIHRFDVGGKSWNSESTAMMVPNFTVANLLPILKKKHKALKEYFRCDEQWLLIYGDGLPDSYYDNFDISEAVDTLFDRIFFMQRGKHLSEIITNKMQLLPR